MSDAVPRPGTDPELRQTTAPDGTLSAELSGAWNLRSLERKLAVITPRLAVCAGARGCRWDLSGVTSLDHAGAMLVWRAWGRRRAENVRLRPEHETLFAHLGVRPAKSTVRRRDWWA